MVRPRSYAVLVFRGAYGRAANIITRRWLTGCAAILKCPSSAHLWACSPIMAIYRSSVQQTQLIVKTLLTRLLKRWNLCIDRLGDDHHGNQHIPQSKAHFLPQMAKKYSSVPNVIYEIWNGTGRRYQAGILLKIMACTGDHPKYAGSDPDNLIVVGSPHWDQGCGYSSCQPYYRV